MRDLKTQIDDLKLAVMDYEDGLSTKEEFAEEAIEIIEDADNTYTKKEPELTEQDLHMENLKMMIPPAELVRPSVQQNVIADLVKDLLKYGEATTPVGHLTHTELQEVCEAWKSKDYSLSVLNEDLTIYYAQEVL